MNKKLIIPVAALSLFAVASAAGIQTAYAQASEGTSMIEKLAQRFNLDQAEVESFFQEERDARQAERASILEEKLAKAVSEGKLTEEQKTALQEKMQSRHANRDNMANLTPEERKEKMQTERDEFRTWLDEQDIDMQSLDLGFGKEGIRGERRMHGDGRGLRSMSE